MAFNVKRERLDGRNMRSIVESASTEAAGLKNLYKTIEAGFAGEKPKLSLENFSFRDLAIGCGVLHEGESWAEAAPFIFSNFRDQSAGGRMMEQRVFNESNANLNTDVFQTLLTDLIDTLAITRDTAQPGFVGRSLCRVRRDNRPVRKMVGATALGNVAPTVHEGHAYNETTFDEKYVSTGAHKFGSILSVTMETVMQDDMGMVVDKMNTIGEEFDTHIEYYILSMIADTQATAFGYVYKPSGTDTTLYSSGNDNLLTSTALVDHTDLDAVWNYRIANAITDNVDGSSSPLYGINSGRKTLLVPATLFATANRIKNSTLVDIGSGPTTRVAGSVVNDGLVDEVVYSEVLDGFSTSTWYYGNFQKQFVLRQLLDRQIFTQGGDSGAAFENDIVLRIKVREYLGVNAIDTPFVTKVTA